jgi:1,2-diacylglycerol 3-alpha-glucosyltransferase
MNILLVADLYYPQVSGCSYFAQRLAYHLTQRGHRVVVIAPSESFSFTDQVIGGVRVYGVRSYPVFLYPKFRLCLFPFYNKKIDKIVSDFKPDVVHFQHHLGVNRAVLRVVKKKGIPTVATNHFMPETMLHYLPLYSIFGSAMITLAWKDFASVFKKIDRITTPTTIAASLIAPYFTKPIMPISCGIDLNRFKPGQNSEELRKRYHIPQIPVLLYVGRLDKEKNLEFVIQAAAVAMNSVNFQLVIAGIGARKKILMKWVQHLGIETNVTFMGFVPDDDLPLLYCLADCFVIAGTAELQSIVTMEAMASGLPILAVDAVALPELVIHGENGFLFDPTDVVGLEEKIVLVLKNLPLRQSMAKKSIEYIAPHDLEKVMCKFEEVYSDVRIVPVRTSYSCIVSSN